MNARIVSYYVGQLFIVLSLFMLAPLGLSFHDGTMAATNSYAGCAVLSFLLGVLLRRFVGKEEVLKISRKDAFGIVAFCWIGAGFLSGLPFFFEGSISSLSSSIFEAISGLSTTGATVIGDVDGLTRATHLWRVLLHWIGGMGIVVLFVAIFPQLGIGGKHLFRSESTGPISEGLKPRIKQTALRLWWLYLSMTIICLFLLRLCGLSFFDALCHAFSTLSTGGFSTKGASLGAFENPMAEWVVIVFMFLGGLNFGLFYNVFQGHWQRFTASIEVRAFFLINFFVSLFIFLVIVKRDGTFFIDQYRDVLFQTLAVTTTTGLMTADFDLYPILGKYLLFLCMFIGGCAGSTAGGIKVSRILVLAKRTLQEIKIFLHPHEVLTMKLGQQKIKGSIVSSIFIFIALYFFIYIAGVFAMLALGLDFMSAASSVVACLASVGPGFAAVGPTQTYEFIHPLGKFILCFMMIAGRLELFVLIALLSPHYWRRG